MLAVTTGSGAGRPAVTIHGEGRVQLAAGGVGHAVLSVRGRPPFTIAETELSVVEPADGISVEGMHREGEGVAIAFKVDPAKAKPGLKGNLIVEAFGKRAARKRWSMGYLPAIPFEVVAGERATAGAP
jgi:hypothetical protein